MNLFILLIFVSTFLAQTNVKLSLNKLSKSSILKNELIIKGDEDGFYESVISTVSTHGKILIYDVGNKQLYIFNAKGKIETQFGKEGNGPGEFPSVFFSGSIFANEDLIYFKLGQKVMIFDYAGKLKSEIATGFGLNQSEMIVEKNKVVFYYQPSELTKLLKAEYDLNGKLIAEIKNPEFNEEELNSLRGNGGNGNRANANGANRNGGGNGGARRLQNGNFLKNMIERPRSLTFINNGFVRHFGGAYHLELLSMSMKIESKVTRDFTRLKFENDMEMIPPQQRRFAATASANATEQQKKMLSQIITNLKNLNGGLKDDIQDILGSYKKYIFIQTASKSNKTLEIDVVLGPDVVHQIQISGDEITTSAIANGKLLVNFKNEENGPYVKIYDLSL
jgi:hypothetical protein